MYFSCFYKSSYVLMFSCIKGISVMLQFKITKIVNNFSIIHVEQKLKAGKIKSACIRTMVYFIYFSFTETAFWISLCCNYKIVGIWNKPALVSLMFFNSPCGLLPLRPLTKKKKKDGKIKIKIFIKKQNVTIWHPFPRYNFNLIRWPWVCFNNENQEHHTSQSNSIRVIGRQALSSLVKSNQSLAFIL